MKSRVIIHTMDGKKWRGDAEDATPAEMESVHEFIGNLKDMTRLSIPIEGHKVYFNPAHIVCVAVVTEEN